MENNLPAINNFSLVKELITPKLPCTEVSFSCAGSYVERLAFAVLGTVGIGPMMGITPGKNIGTALQLVGNFVYRPELIQAVVGAGLHSLNLLGVLWQTPILARSTSDPIAALTGGRATGIQRAQGTIGNQLWAVLVNEFTNRQAKNAVSRKLANLTNGQIENWANGTGTNANIKQALSLTNDVAAAAVRTAFTQAKNNTDSTTWNTLITAWRHLDDQKNNNAISQAALQQARSPSEMVATGRRAQVASALFWTSVYLISGVSATMYHSGVQVIAHLQAEVVGDNSSKLLQTCAEQGGLAWFLNTPGLHWMNTTTISLTGWCVSWLPLALYARQQYNNITEGKLSVTANLRQEAFWSGIANRLHWYALAAMSNRAWGTGLVSSLIGGSIQLTGLASGWEASELGATLATITLLGLTVHRCCKTKEQQVITQTVNDFASVMFFSTMVRATSQGFQWLARSVTHGWHCTMAEAAFA